MRDASSAFRCPYSSFSVYSGEGQQGEAAEHLGVTDLWYADSYTLHVEPPHSGEDQANGSGEEADEAIVEWRSRRPLPAWARFMSDLGSDLALISPEEPTTAVVSLPTREFAAAFAGAAVVIRYDELDPAAPDDLEEHLADLRDMEPGTRIQYRAANGKIWEGRWRGFQAATDGQEHVCMEVRKEMTMKIRVSEALRVVPSGEEAANDARLRVRNVETSHLLRRMRGQPAAVAFVTTTRLEVVIVGVATVLQEEMCEQGLYASGNEDDLRHGYLQDIVRVQQFPSAHRFYRSQVLPPSIRGEEQQALSPRVVIYDGGRMFLQSSHLWRGSHRIVVLDRSAASAEDAALEIAQDYADRRGNSELGEDLTVPAGVEVISYRHAT